MRKAAEEFIARSGLSPVIAAEIEFYLPTEPDEARLRRLLAGAGVDIFHFEQERGRGQYEASLVMQREAREIIRQTQALKAVLTEYGADFSAMPFPDQPGSGLHVHVHLEDASGANVFYKKDEIVSDALRFSIGGLLATLRENLNIFAPNSQARARLKAGGTAPSTLSWGANNRTVAIRLPDEGAPQRHIEHRVASADADPENVIAAVLSGMAYGIENRCDPGPQTYGDAHLPVYGLPKIIA